MITLFVDGAVRAEVAPLLASGAFTGVTTNPTILRRTGMHLDDLADLYSWAVAAGAQEVCLQTWGATQDDLLLNARRLRELGDRVTVKVPVGIAGLTVVAELHRAHVPTLLTAVHTVEQVVLGVAAGVRWIAPYLGRLEDAGRDSHGTVEAMQRVCHRTDGRTRLLVASVRSGADVATLAAHGVDGFTLAPALARALFDDALTDRAMQQFDADCEGFAPRRQAAAPQG